MTRPGKKASLFLPWLCGSCQIRLLKMKCISESLSLPLPIDLYVLILNHSLMIISCQEMMLT